MKILIVGASGTIGNAVAELLSREHEVVRAGHSAGEYRVDVGSSDSIRALYGSVGPVDAVISAAGQAAFGPLAELNDGAFELALSNKLMGQINLVRLGREHVSEGGSFTLTAGILSRQPIPGSAVISMANGALESFARAAALEPSRGQRVNVVSPGFVKETMEKMGMDSASGVSAADVAVTYRMAVLGTGGDVVLDAIGAA